MSPWKSFAALATFCILLSACSRQATKQQADATPEPPGSTLPPPAAKATPPPVAVATPTPVPEKRLAPEGVFYLIRGKSIETADGIVGIKPGTKVIRQKDGKFLADGQKIALQPAEITNDMDIAARVGNAEALAQVRIRQAALAAAATPVPATPPPVAAPPPPPPVPVPPEPAPTTTPPPARTAANPVENMFVLPNTGDTAPKSNASRGNTVTRYGWVWEKGPDGQMKRLKPIR
jgi:hypothetical protein